MAEVINNKISIFPFDIDIDSKIGPQKGKVFKLNMLGMIVEVSTGAFVPQLPLNLKFIVPLDNKLIQDEGLVVKTYNQHQGEKMKYFVEIHFKKLKPQNKDALDQFLRKYEDMLAKAKIKKAQS